MDSRYVARRIGLITGLVTTGLLASGCYATRQAWHQGKMLMRRTALSEAVKDPTTPPEVQQRLSEVPRLLDFARLYGLTPGESYQKYIDNGDRPVSWLVYAAYPERLELKTWWFPFVGSVPYLGYFSKSERDEQARQFKDQGLDVATGAVSAFSMLGFLPDPVYRSMTRRSRIDFAHLIFHELVHRTVWIKGSVAFNERFAEIFSQRMTLAWLNQQDDTEANRQFLKAMADQELFSKWAISLKSALEQIYESKIPDGELKLKKSDLIRRWTTVEKPAFAGTDLVGGREWNNASLLAAQLYSGNRFHCQLTPMNPERGKLLIAWAVAQKNSDIATDATLEKVCL